jgi:hypothetical protein
VLATATEKFAGPATSRARIVRADQLRGQGRGGRALPRVPSGMLGPVRSITPGWPGYQRIRRLVGSHFGWPALAAYAATFVVALVVLLLTTHGTAPLLAIPLALVVLVMTEAIHRRR